MTGLLDGKIALVTGAGHGIGRGHALELAKHGATVIVNDLGTTLAGEGTGKVADEVVQIIESRGGKAVSDFSDVGDEEQVDLAVERAYSQLGRLDIVVNNAGIVRDKAIWNMTVDDFDLVMRVHVRGSWLTSRAVARKWRAESKEIGLEGLRPDHQHHLRRGPARALRADELQRGQVGDRRADPDAEPGTGVDRRHREHHQPRRPDPDVGDDARRCRADRTRRALRGRVRPQGPVAEFTRGGLAGQPGGRPYQRSGHPRAR